MTDAINLSRGGVGASPRLYQSEGVREVQSRARFLEQAQTPQEQAGLKRLDRLLSQDTQLEGTALRGFYLNIRV